MYDIDILAKESNEKIGSGNLSYDLYFSAKDNKSRIQNLSFKVTKEPTANMIQSKISAVAGNNTDVAAFDCYIYTESDTNPIDLLFTVSADKDGKTLITYRKNVIAVDNESEDQYKYDSGFRVVDQTEDTVSRERKVESKYPLKLLKEGEFKKVDNLDLSYRIKEYESQAVPLDAKDSKGNNISDLNTKDFKYRVEFKTAIGKNIGTYDIEGNIKYSKAADYTFLIGSGFLSEGYNDWEANTTSTKVGNYTNLNSLAFQTVITDDDVEKYKVDIVISGNGSGEIQIKPIVAS